MNKSLHLNAFLTTVLLSVSAFAYPNDTKSQNENTETIIAFDSEFQRPRVSELCKVRHLADTIGESPVRVLGFDDRYSAEYSLAIADRHARTLIQLIEHMRGPIKAEQISLGRHPDYAGSGALVQGVHAPPPCFCSYPESNLYFELEEQVKPHLEGAVLTSLVMNGINFEYHPEMLVTNYIELVPVATQSELIIGLLSHCQVAPTETKPPPG